MRSRIANRFLINYMIMFFISILIALLVFVLTDFADDVISKNLMKNNYTAEQLMRDDYHEIPYTQVIENGGGVQVVDLGLEVILSKGIDTINREKLSMDEWTEFLTDSKKIGLPYSYDIVYNSEKNFWLVVTFPTSVRMDFSIAHNELYPSKDAQAVSGIIIAVILLYFLLLAVVTLIYSRLTSIGFVNPLKRLYHSAKRLGEGDYSARVEIYANDEIGELAQIFNIMAEKIEKEIDLRVTSEENRKQLILDISHDLKNPLSSILGYAEQCRSNPELSEDKRQEYIKVIYDNSIRVNRLINDLFELSKLESDEYKIEPARIDICEYLRAEMAILLPLLEDAEFTYDFYIPEEEIFVFADINQLSRVFHNLIQNAVQYNPKGTNLTVEIKQKNKITDIIVKDNGIGISKDTADHIFEAFVRDDPSRNSEKGGTGLGLAIAEKIMKAHGGSIDLITEADKGCEFILHLPEND